VDAYFMAKAAGGDREGVQKTDFVVKEVALI
jgi:hypothetical protein